MAYRVDYSGRVRKELLKLIARATDRGLRPQVLQALQRIDYCLRTYPQFGQPLSDLKLEPIQLWIAVVAPLVVRYALNEERREVSIGVPIRPLPHTGLDP